ncbi:MAG TPA: oxygenase MpaB family protein [Gemmataceae bacterium]|nr:oxygenase MpaB family protein [Gemmataceae bacterium]
MFRSPVLAEIRTLHPEKDNQRIVFLSTRIDFPFDTTRALEFALFRTFSVPRIAALLDQTGEFQHRPQKRYDDTDIIVSELMEHGYDSPRGRAALRRMNQLHGRFTIANEEFLYVLSTFIYEPIRWNRRFGWRLMCAEEQEALFYFWLEVGRRMNLKELPRDLRSFECYNIEYEQTNFRFTPANYRVGAATRELFASWFPRVARPLVRRAIYALLDDPLIQAFGFPKPSPAMRWLVTGGLKLRARCLHWLPRRRQPVLRTERRQRSYPDGYQIDRLGPPETLP